MTTDNLQPGPALDALVAQKVMGWTQIGPFVGSEFWQPGNIKVKEWRPSISIAAAMEVANKFTTRYFYYDDATCTWFVGLDNSRRSHDDCRWQAAAPELPYAICLAALKASGL